jgi:polar amino acid transport system ATP-binding protein
MDYKLESTVLYAENVSVQYDGRDVIKNINMIEKDVVREGTITGQIIAIVGRSGRGKSTLFKVLTGLVKPCTGTILIPEHGDPSKAKIVEEGDVGFVNQKYTLFRNKTVKEALLFALRNSELSKEDKLKKINDSVTEWGLLDHLNKYPSQLSGGQRQRVAILEQMFSSENFIIMDEPFSGLDVGNIESVKHAFKRIASENEFNTIIFSTHDLELAVELADSIYVVGYPTIEGQLQNYGTIVKQYDLKEMGLAWNNEMTVMHYDLVHKIKEDLLNS